MIMVIYVNVMLVSSSIGVRSIDNIFWINFSLEKKKKKKKKERKEIIHLTQIGTPGFKSEVSV